MSPLFYAAFLLLIGGPADCFFSASMGRAATVCWWVGFALWIFGLILFVVAVAIWLAGPVQGIIGAHGATSP